MYAPFVCLFKRENSSFDECEVCEKMFISKVGSIKKKGNTNQEIIEFIYILLQEVACIISNLKLKDLFLCELQVNIYHT